MPSEPDTTLTDDSPESSLDDVARIEELFDAGDWRSARAEIERRDLSTLDEDARQRLELVAVRTSTDRVATAIAVVLGVGYLIILGLLFL